MDAKKIILDRLDAALRRRGVTLKRSALLETASSAFGYHNSNEFTAANRRGDLDGTAALLEAVDEEAPAIRETIPEDPEPRYLVLDADRAATSLHDDPNAARAAAESSGDREACVVDSIGWTLSRARTGWRDEPLVQADGGTRGRAVLAARALLAEAAVDDLTNRLESERNLGPDWRRWEKDLRKASHKRQGPIDDESLYRFRHAVADNHCKSSEGERSTVRWRERMFVERHLGGLMARLDRAEDALRAAGLEPSGTSRLPADEAAERLAAIEAVRPRRADRTIPGLWKIDATRDGDRCREIFRVENGADPEDRGRAIAAKEFRMDLSQFTDEDGDASSFDSECDTFSVDPVGMPEAAEIISDVLSELSTSCDFPHGMPHDHPARIKLIAARRSITPEATV